MEFERTSAIKKINMVYCLSSGIPVIVRRRGAEQYKGHKKVVISTEDYTEHYNEIKEQLVMEHVMKLTDIEYEELMEFVSNGEKDYTPRELGEVD